MLGFDIPVLSGIFGILGKLVDYIVTGLMTWVNLLLHAIGAAITAFMSLLPSMPSPPTAPVADWVGWLNWLAPVGPAVAALLVWVGLWLTYLVVRIPLRWLKVL